jgi:N-acetylglucosaminyldiphosphoundecaprenol N-acetyl-beta-D-mannosaminyltransferase
LPAPIEALQDFPSEVANSMEDSRSSKFSLAGIRVDALKRDDLVKILDRAKASTDKVLILNHNLHSLYLYSTLPDFRALYAKASFVYIDGIPVVWLARLAGLPVTSEHRITLLDSFDAVLEEASRLGWRIFYLGSTEDVFSKGLSILHSRYPNLIIQGRNGYINKESGENDQVLSQIKAFRPDLLFVGMGMPVQERWLLENLPEIDAHSVITCGATLDYVTGEAYKPPAWAGPLGLYGVFRFFSDPLRLWSRYLTEPIVLLWHLLLPILRQRLMKTDKIWISPEESEIVQRQS